MFQLLMSLMMEWEKHRKQSIS